MAGTPGLKFRKKLNKMKKTPYKNTHTHTHTHRKVLVIHFRPSCWCKHNLNQTWPICATSGCFANQNEPQDHNNSRSGSGLGHPSIICASLSLPWMIMLWNIIKEFIIKWRAKGFHMESGPLIIPHGACRTPKACLTALLVASWNLANSFKVNQKIGTFVVTSFEIDWYCTAGILLNLGFESFGRMIDWIRVNQFW